MKVTPTPTSGAADLLDLIEAYAEARHIHGHSSYNAKTAAALQAVKDALAAGQATAAQGVVPAGWKLVPVDATDEMVRATDEVNFENGDTDGTLHNVWHVMIAAAPARPAAQQGVAYAALPEKYYLAGGEVPTWDAKQMRAFADATCALRASHGQAPAWAGMGHTDGGRNMFYEGRFDGESQREQQARLRWANDMRAAFERHTGNGWFDKDWRTETGLWSSAWHACLAAHHSHLQT